MQAGDQLSCVSCFANILQLAINHIESMAVALYLQALLRIARITPVQKANTVFHKHHAWLVDNGFPFTHSIPGLLTGLAIGNVKKTDIGGRHQAQKMINIG